MSYFVNRLRGFGKLEAILSVFTVAARRLSDLLAVYDNQYSDINEQIAQLNSDRTIVLGERARAEVVLDNLNKLLGGTL